MEASMNEKFCEKQNTLIFRQRENTSFLSKEKYDMLIHKISTRKLAKGTKNYQLLQRYDVFQIGHARGLA